MPFQSKSQRRFMYAAEDRGDVPKGTAKRWEEHTPKDKPLPEKVASVKSHLAAGGAGAALGAIGAGYLGLRHGEKQRRLGQLQAANYLLAGPHGQSIRETTLTPQDIDNARSQGQYEEQWLSRNIEKTAFERGFEKKAGAVTNFLVKNQKKIGLGLGGEAAVAGTGAVINTEMKKQANFAHAAELAGLGILAAPAAHELANKEQAEKFWTPKKKAIAEVSGLGVLAAPSIAHFLARK